eukprot:CAMPEP_0170336570 /NCGR_PEP_ID=MMETSP0116_2-20130129/69329_1 /TAXON_ID=400756 /ORGANISM="Durinskia baltica, Strain CSIRO CS-38" /LENGTH=246 /DNA_ID=CAMNT_0010589961 /DNA_START=205 /DNA_END=942 /DNA_ORIENTATION=+
MPTSRGSSSRTCRVLGAARRRREATALTAAAAAMPKALATASAQEYGNTSPTPCNPCRARAAPPDAHASPGTRTLRRPGRRTSTRRRAPGTGSTRRAGPMGSRKPHAPTGTIGDWGTSAAGSESFGQMDRTMSSGQAAYLPCPYVRISMQTLLMPGQRSPAAFVAASAFELSSSGTSIMYHSMQFVCSGHEFKSWIPASTVYKTGSKEAAATPTCADIGTAAAVFSTSTEATDCGNAQTGHQRSLE